jgi:hypothetical protein
MSAAIGTGGDVDVLNAVGSVNALVHGPAGTELRGLEPLPHS